MLAVSSLLVAVAVSVPVPHQPATAGKSPELVQDEQTFFAAGLSSDGSALLDFFRGRTRLDVDRAELLALARQLGDSSAEVRGRAAARLVARGPVAVPVLRYVINDLDDPVVAGRARRCLALIEGPGGSTLPAAAARLLAVRRPGGAAEALLAYLPLADNETVASEVGAALGALAFADGKPEPILLHALVDPVPARRAAAAEALTRKDQPEQWPVVRKLLSDPKPMVRLRTAVALARQHDLEAIPILIDLIAELPAAQRRPAEDVLQELAGEWSPNLGLPRDDDVSRRIRRDAWAAWWRHTDGPTLLAEFRKRTLSPSEQQVVADLIRKLSDDSFPVREQAAARLVAYGLSVVPVLREAARGSDLERARRAEECLRQITQDAGQVFPSAAARLLALRKPAGAAEVLLAYLPFTEDETMFAEVQTALTDLALRDGKPEPVLVRALEDVVPLKRAAAGEALGKAGGPAVRDAVRKLLRDADATVRLRAALALTNAGDRDAVPVLIELLAVLPPERGWPAEDVLHQLAGEQAPKVSPGNDAASRQKYRDAWAAWWKQHGSGVDLARLTSAPRLLGYTMIVHVDPNGIGRVVEIDRAGKTRWQVENLQYPVDAWVLPGNRVLVAEYNGRRVTERNFKGDLLWEKANLAASPHNVQRLANGNTFIVTTTEVLEVDRTGTTVFSKAFPNGLVAGFKSPNGLITLLTNQAQCLRLDAAGKELKNFPSGRDPGWTSGIDVLPNGNTLISRPNMNQVAEVNAEGKTVWEVNAPGLTTATRLPNGNTLVASYNMRAILELDRAGKTVWEHRDNYHPFRARRR